MEKIEAIKASGSIPDMMMDLSLIRMQKPLYLIAQEKLNVENLIYRTLSDLRYLSNSRFNWKASFGVTHTNEKQFDYEELYRGPIKNVYLSNAEDRNSVMLLK